MESIQSIYTENIFLLLIGYTLISIDVEVNILYHSFSVRGMPQEIVAKSQ